MACTGIGPTALVSLAPRSSSRWDSAPDLAGLPPSRCCSHSLGRAQRVLLAVGGGELLQMRCVWEVFCKCFVNLSLHVRKFIIFYCIFLRKLELGEKNFTFPHKSFLALWRWCKMPLNIIKLWVSSEFH